MAARLAVSRAISYHTVAERVTFNRRLVTAMVVEPARPKSPANGGRSYSSATLPGEMQSDGTALGTLRTRWHSA
jgi:hypothetical protein